MQNLPYLLPFTLVSCDGGMDDVGFEPENALRVGEESYCSINERNVNILLKYNGDSDICTLTNYVVAGPPVDYTAPLKTGLLFLSEKEINVEDTKVYDDFTLEDFNRLKEEGGEGLLPYAFFDTQDGIYYSFTDVISPVQYAKYALFKLIDAHATTNIDVNFLGLVGFDGRVETDKVFPNTCEELDLVPPAPEKFQEITPENEDLPGNAMTSVLFYNDEKRDIGETVRDVLEEYANRVKCGIVFWCSEGELYYSLKEYFGLTEDIDIIFFGKNNVQYLFSKAMDEELNGVSVIEFYEKAVAHSLPTYYKSEEIPEHPIQYGLTTVVGNTFNEFATENGKYKLLFAYNPYFTFLEDFKYEYIALANILESNEDLEIGIIDSEGNDFDTSIITEIPSIVLFRPGQKLVSYPGEFVLEELLDFLQENCNIDTTNIMENLPSVVQEVKKRINKNVIKIMHEHEFQSLISSDQLVVAYWHAPWVPPCLQIAPKFAVLSDEYPTIKFLQIDLDDEELEELAEEYQVSYFPSFTFIRNRTVLSTVEGTDESVLRRMLTENAD